MPSAPLILKSGHLIFAVCNVAFVRGKVDSKLQSSFTLFANPVLVICQWSDGKLSATSLIENLTLWYF